MVFFQGVIFMEPVKNILDWMSERNLGMDDLVRSCALDRKIVEAIVHGRYTPSPQQRQRLSNALGVSPEQVAWGHTTPVEHIHGHGPQFGRSP